MERLKLSASRIEGEKAYLDCALLARMISPCSAKMLDYIKHRCEFIENIFFILCTCFNDELGVPAWRIYVWMNSAESEKPLNESMLCRLLF